ncbi:MAG: NAD(P)-dependent oxidoreductase [Eggerthellaceae bacterium]|nr:NAD(P)-dependent oxidoreductase [Eggerthellaceae bacterium]
MAKAFAYSGDSGFLAAITPRMREAGYTRVSDSASADIAITFCTTQAELEELYLGSEGFVSIMAPGSLLIDFSAATPNFSRELSAVAMVSDLVMVEAPIVVDSMVAEDAFARDNISCFVAGEESGIERASEVLELIFGRVVPTGGFGTAQLARAA